MRPFDRQRILLGVTGGIASYKAAWLARLLTQGGAEVDVVMTRSALEFVGAVTFEALTGRSVHSALIATGHALDHIRLARAADLVLVAPATADFLARAVHGHADELLSACLLATNAPVLLVPAMNDRMWAHAAVQANVAAARRIGYHVLDPDDGNLAVGEGSGPGRMPEPETILAHAARLLETRSAQSSPIASANTAFGAETSPSVMSDSRSSLRGARVLVTAGPTREPVDPVRFLSNRSSGRMGVEIAAAAWRRGAEVTLVAGPLEVAAPIGVRVVSVETTQQMLDAVAIEIASCDVLVMAAAPADFTAAAPSSHKLKKAERPDRLALIGTPDILQTTRALRPAGMIAVGFALETGDPRREGQRKLVDKGLDLAVLNDATEEGAGFGVSTNRVTILAADGSATELPLLSKRDVADAILDRVEELRRER